MITKNNDNVSTSTQISQKLHRQSFGTAWLFGWLILVAWFGFGREWLRHSPSPAMASTHSVGGSPSSQSTFASDANHTRAARATSNLEAVAISSMKVGDQVPAHNPTGEKDDEFGDTVDPPSWRKLVLLAPKKDGSFAEVELLRPLTWLEVQHAEVGGSVEIHVPECGIEGRAELLAIEPCPAIKHDQRFRIVTGTFKHQASKVLDVYVEGLDEPIGTTPNHPFWSEDRQTFVRADELKEGEHLQAFNGTPIVRRVVPLADSEPVFNLEVQCDHVYHVAKNGVLVHNSADDCFVTLYHGTTQTAADAIRRNGIDASFFRAKQDFGRGFYTTLTREQAERWATRNGGEVLQFRIRQSELDALRGQTFFEPNQRWRDFVTQNRLGNSAQPTVDFIEGPMVGNVRGLLNGGNAGAWGHQLTFYSDEAFNLLMRGLMP